MEVFGKGTEEGTRPLLPPGVCWICDMSPTQEVQRVIDTRRNSRPGQTALHVTERKYVCESCALELGAAMGMVKAEEHEREKRDNDLLVERAQRAERALEAERGSKVRVVAADEIADVVAETVRAELAKKQAKPKAATKPPTDEASWGT